MKARTIDLAIAELNRKWCAVLMYCEEDTDKAIVMLQNDLEKMKQLVGEAPQLDNNYSLTWGYNKYGLYNSLDEMQEIAEIIDGGF